MTYKLLPFLVCMFLTTQNIINAYSAEHRCLYVSSYHQGYAWSDAVQEGLTSTLSGHCEYRQFDMDTKRKKSTEDKINAANEAKALIESWKPDVVITSDDNAARYLIQAHYKDSNLPFVFCGVNWTVNEYGFPYKNVTGIIEVAPIQPMLEKARSITGKYNRFLYLGAKTTTEEKNARRFVQAAETMGIDIEVKLVLTADDWLKAFQLTDGYDFIAMGSNAGIENWDKNTMTEKSQRHATILSVTNHQWMMPYTAYGMTKIPQEHGEWAAEAAIVILQGTSPSDIPIVSNRKWDEWINEAQWQQLGIPIPDEIQFKAKRM